MAHIIVDALGVSALLYFMLGVTDTKTIATFVFALLLLKVVAEKMGINEELEKRIR